jgi:hypothetical protein
MVRPCAEGVALRRGDAASALAVSGEVAGSTDAPTVYALQAELIAIESLLALGRMDEAEQRLGAISGRVEPGVMSGIWGEFLRMRGRLHAAAGRSTEAYHDFGQSVSVFDLLGEGYQSTSATWSSAAGRRCRRACGHPLPDRCRDDPRSRRLTGSRRPARL